MLTPMRKKATPVHQESGINPHKKALQSTGLVEDIYVMHVLHVIIFKYYFRHGLCLANLVDT